MSLLLAATVTLLIKNETKEEVRIDGLRSRCGQVLISAEKPVRLKPNQEAKFEIEPVIHTYTICGGGLCAASAFGFKRDHKGNYRVALTFDKSRLITATQTPDHWVGNMECSK